MSTNALIARARAGESEAFDELTQPYRRELGVHCYRMLGSYQDAEDVLQETLLAAWQGLNGFEERASLRTWLYRIATNRCLNARRSAGRRRAKEWDVPGVEPPEPTRLGEVPWLQPYPDTQLPGSFEMPPGPEARYEQSESISLAFVTALQLLPPRQLAVLVLRDVLGFHATEVAAMLESTVESVTSALKRARASLELKLPMGCDSVSVDMSVSPSEDAIVAKFVAAYESSDLDSLVALLTDDVFIAMPPLPFEYVGREPASRFFASIFGSDRQFDLVPTRANGQPALGAYVLGPDGVSHGVGLFVLTLSGDEICAMTRFETRCSRGSGFRGRSRADSTESRTGGGGDLGDNDDRVVLSGFWKDAAPGRRGAGWSRDVGDRPNPCARTRPGDSLSPDRIARRRDAMTYAGDRVILDADSHVMELTDFLNDFIDPDHAPRLRRRGLDALSPRLDDAVAKAEARRLDPSVAARAEERLMADKGWVAMGGFDPRERSRVLDLLGFDAQLVFATFATAMFSLPHNVRHYTDPVELRRDVDLLYAGASAQNRAMASFCGGDPRLLPVGFVPLVDAERAIACASEAIGAGCAAVMVPSTAAGERAPTHPDLDEFWSLLEEADTPFVLHVGGGGRLLDPAFHNNDMPVTDHLGGGENIRSKDYLAIHHSPEVFLGALILDGLFDRHPELRGGCIEQGAGWVVSWLRHLDYAQRAFRRTEEPLRRLEDKPSEYVRRHLKFTPFPGEPVGWMMEQAGSELFMFSTDYPHPEGGRDPLAKFEESLEHTGKSERALFYTDNMAQLMGSRLHPSAGITQPH